MATIRRSLTRKAGPGKRRIKEPKTGRGRQLPIQAWLAARLREHRARQASRALRLGDAFDREGDLVFANGVGEPLDDRNLSQRFLRPVVESTEGLPAHVRLYDLRHTHATLLLSDGVHPKVAAERLGHTSTRMTLDVYSHVQPHMQEDAIARLDRVLS